jgi:hypothetical protein
MMPSAAGNQATGVKTEWARTKLGKGKSSLIAAFVSA